MATCSSRSGDNPKLPENISRTFAGEEIGITVWPRLMIDNPYQASFEPARQLAVAVDTGSRDKLRKVARYQRWILCCVLLHLTFVGLTAAVRYAQAYQFLNFMFAGLVLTWIAGLLPVFLLAFNVYKRSVAVVLGFLASTPILGFIVVLIVHTKANSMLRQKGVEVGFLGANPTNIAGR